MRGSVEHPGGNVLQVAGYVDPELTLALSSDPFSL